MSGAVYIWLAAIIVFLLVEAGTVAPVIDRRYELSEAAQALAHQGEGHTRGKIVIAV